MPSIRAQGAGAQSVNEVSKALHLRFDLRASSLPAEVKQRLLQSRDQRISGDDVVVVKAQRYRNARLREVVEKAAAVRPQRRATDPTATSQQRRLQGPARSDQGRPPQAGRRMTR